MSKSIPAAAPSSNGFKTGPVLSEKPYPFISTVITSGSNYKIQRDIYQLKRSIKLSAKRTLASMSKGGIEKSISLSFAETVTDEAEAAVLSTR